MVIKTIDTIDESGAKGVNDQLNAAIKDASVKTETKAALRTVMGKQATADVLATASGAKEDLQKFKREVLQQPARFTVEAIRTDIHDKIFGVLAAYNNADGLNFSADVAALRPGFAPQRAGATAPGAAPQTGAAAQEKTLNYDEYMKKNYPNPDDTKGYKAIFATMSYWAYRIGRWFDWSKKNPTTNGANSTNGNGTATGAETVAGAPIAFDTMTSVNAHDLLGRSVRSERLQTTGRIEIASNGIFIHVVTPSGDQRKYRVKSTLTSKNGGRGEMKQDFSDVARLQTFARGANIVRDAASKTIKVVPRGGAVGRGMAGVTEFDEAKVLEAVATAARANYDANDLNITVPYTETYTRMNPLRPLSIGETAVDRNVVTITLVKA